MKAHGAPALMAHLRGEMSLEQAVEIAKRDTRRYAKRQFTWIANQMPDWRRIETVDVDACLGLVLPALKWGTGWLG
jgi:tRNA dimethylallyltransferase